jgi:hypothetical protein
MYNDNPDDPSARLLYYGIFRVPYSFMDGGGVWAKQYDYSIDPKPNQPLSENDLLVRALVDPDFSIDLHMSTPNSGVYSITGTITALRKIPASKKVNVQTAVLERTVNLTGANGDTKFNTVLKKLLPDAAGSYPTASWDSGHVETISLNYTSKNVYNASQLYAVMFLQDANNKEILQAATTDTNTLSTGFIEIAANGDENEFSIYPNPANDKTYFVLLEARKEVTYITIYDMVGAQKKIIAIQPFQNSVEVDLTGFRPGIYIVKPAGTGINAKRLVITK